MDKFPEGNTGGLVQRSRPIRDRSSGVNNFRSGACDGFYIPADLANSALGCDGAALLSRHSKDVRVKRLVTQLAKLSLDAKLTIFFQPQRGPSFCRSVPKVRLRSEPTISRQRNE
jgi:hypothetical protein